MRNDKRISVALSPGEFALLDAVCAPPSATRSDVLRILAGFPVATETNPAEPGARLVVDRRGIQRPFEALWRAGLKVNDAAHAVNAVALYSHWTDEDLRRLDEPFSLWGMGQMNGWRRFLANKLGDAVRLLHESAEMHTRAAEASEKWGRQLVCPERDFRDLDSRDDPVLAFVPGDDPRRWTLDTWSTPASEGVRRSAIVTFRISSGELLRLDARCLRGGMRRSESIRFALSGIGLEPDEDGVIRASQFSPGRCALQLNELKHQEENLEQVRRALPEIERWAREVDDPWEVDTEGRRLPSLVTHYPVSTTERAELVRLPAKIRSAAAEVADSVAASREQWEGIIDKGRSITDAQG